MKKSLGIVCAMGLLFGIAGSSMADQATWTMYLKASNPTYSSAAGNIKIGTSTLAQNGFESNDKTYTANSGSQAQVAVYQSSWGGTPAFYAQDLRAPLNGNYPATRADWELRVWAGTGYSGSTIRLALYGSASAPMVQYIDGQEYRYDITVLADPTGTYKVGDIIKMDKFASAGTSTNPLVYMDFNNISSVKLTDAAAVDSGIKLGFRAAAVPEPGSMLALGSGLVGLLGFGLRRKH